MRLVRIEEALAEETRGRYLCEREGQESKRGKEKKREIGEREGERKTERE